jgi:hypothetical protein
LVDRLERSGLVARARVDSDGRGVVAVLTQLGYDRLRDATGTHLSGVARHFAGPLEHEDLAAFGRTCERLAGTEPDADDGPDPLPAKESATPAAGPTDESTQPGTDRTTGD